MLLLAYEREVSHETARKPETFDVYADGNFSEDASQRAAQTYLWLVRGDG
jgi:myo-inositol catabolism protein IolC